LLQEYGVLFGRGHAQGFLDQREWNSACPMLGIGAISGLFYGVREPVEYFFVETQQMAETQ
jgi:hypothetical protein